MLKQEVSPLGSGVGAIGVSEKRPGFARGVGSVTDELVAAREEVCKTSNASADHVQHGPIGHSERMRRLSCKD